MLFTLIAWLKRIDKIEAHIHTYTKYMAKYFQFQVEEDCDIFLMLQRISHTSNLIRKTSYCEKKQLLQ